MAIKEFEITDQFYIESGYIDQGYYVYIAEAVAEPSSEFSQSCDAEKIVGGEILEFEASFDSEGTTSVTASKIASAASTITAEFAQTATISHIEGADLFAFSEAQLQLAVDRIRGNNIDATAVFDISVDYVRIIQSDAIVSSEFTQTSSVERSRDINITAEAAFSFEFTSSRIRNNLCEFLSQTDINSAVNKTASGISDSEAAFIQAITPERSRDFDTAIEAAVSINLGSDRIRLTSGTLASETSIFAAISNVRGVDIIQQNFASLDCSAAKTTENQIVLTAENQISATVGYVVDTGAEIVAVGSLSGSSRVLVRPTQITVNNSGRFDPIVIDTDIKRFGAASARFDDITEIFPRTNNIVSTGSTFYIFEPGYTWTSTNATTWNRNTNNLSLTPSDVTYSNNTFVFRSGDTWYYSTNGTSWSSNTPTIAGLSITNYFSGGSITQMAFLNGQWRILGFRSNRIFSANFNALNSSTESSTTELLNVGSTLALNGNFTGTHIVGGYTNVIFSYNGSTVTSKLVGTASSIISPWYDGIDTWACYSGGSLRYSTNNGSTWTSNTNISSPATPDSIRFTNNRWIVSSSNLSTAGTYVGSSITSLTRRITYPIGNVASISNRWAGVDLTKPGQVKYSTDSISWLNDDVEQCSGVPGNLVYSLGNNQELSDFSTIDFRLNVKTSRIHRDSLLTWEDNNNLISVSLSFNSLQLRVNTLLVGSSITIPGLNQWIHYRIARSGTAISIYQNGSRVLNSTIDTWPISPVRISGEDTLVDEFLITKKLLTNPNTTSFTVPTQPWKNDEDTLLLLHFDTDFSDDSRFDPVVIATLTSTASVVAALSGDQTGRADLVSEATVVANVDVDRSSNMEAFSDAALTAVVELIRDHSSDLSAEFSANSDVNVTISFVSDQASDSQLLTDVSVIADGVIATESIASKFAIVAKIGDVVVDLQTESQLSATSQITADADITATTEFTAITAENIVRDNDISAACEISLDIVVDKISSVSSDLVSDAQLSAQLDATKEFTIDLNSEFSVLADGSGGIIRVIALLASGGELISDAVKITDTNADFALESIFGADPVKVTENVSQNQVIANSTIEASRSRDNNVSLIADNQIIIDNERTRSLSIDTGAIATKVIAAGIIINKNISGLAETTLDAQVQKTTDIIANISSVAELSAAGFSDKEIIIHIDSETALIADSSRTRDITCDTESIAVKLTVAVKQAVGEIDLESTANIVIDAVKTVDNTSLIDSNTELSADISLIKQLESQQSLTATVDVITVITASTAADLVSDFSVTAVGNRALDIDLVAFSDASLTTDAAVIRSAESQSIAEFASEITGVRIKDLSSSMITETAISVTVTKLVDSGVLVFDSIATKLSLGRTVRLDMKVYKIPAETRLHVIGPETRLHRIRR